MCHTQHTLAEVRETCQPASDFIAHYDTTGQPKKQASHAAQPRIQPAVEAQHWLSLPGLPHLPHPSGRAVCRGWTGCPRTTAHSKPQQVAAKTGSYSTTTELQGHYHGTRGLAHPLWLAVCTGSTCHALNPTQQQTPASEAKTLPNNTSTELHGLMWTAWCCPPFRAYCVCRLNRHETETCSSQHTPQGEAKTWPYIIVMKLHDSSCPHALSLSRSHPRVC